MATADTAGDLGCACERLAELLVPESERTTVEHRWFEEVEALVVDLRRALGCHTASVVEHGIYDEAIVATPRVAGLVRRFAVECRRMEEMATSTLDTVRQPDRTAAGVEAALEALLRLVDRHASHAIQIDHEAYCVDIGGPG